MVGYLQDSSMKDLVPIDWVPTSVWLKLPHQWYSDTETDQAPATVQACEFSHKRSYYQTISFVNYEKIHILVSWLVHTRYQQNSEPNSDQADQNTTSVSNEGDVWLLVTSINQQKQQTTMSNSPVAIYCILSQDCQEHRHQFQYTPPVSTLEDWVASWWEESYPVWSATQDTFPFYYYSSTIW